MARTENSAAEALGRAHAALLDDLRKLEESVDLPSGNGLAEVRTRLTATATHIAQHFRYEEQGGYMETLRKREPRLELAIQHLAQEHRLLSQSLDALRESAATATEVDDLLRGHIQRWVNHVRQHETRENDLVQDAYNQDIGAKD